MEFSQLRYFLEVAKRGNVTKSARALNVVQPAVSQAINRLELELGTKLFMYDGRTMILTRSGRLLFEEITPVMETLHTLPSKIKALEQSENAMVRMNILAAWTLVSNAIMEYQRIDDMLTIELSETAQADMADISITTRLSSHTASKNTKDDMRIFREQIFLAVPNVARWQGKTRVHLKEVQDCRFITLSDVKHFRVICDKLCASAGMKPYFVFESDSPSAVMNMISAGMGVGFWPAFSWFEPDPRRILLLEIEKPVCSRDIIIMCNTAAKEDVHIRLFYDFLCGYFDIFSNRALEAKQNDSVTK